jgi:hypothetical protein
MRRNFLWFALAVALLATAAGVAARSAAKVKEVEAEAAALAAEENEAKPGLWRSIVNKVNAQVRELIV